MQKYLATNPASKRIYIT